MNSTESILVYRIAEVARHIKGLLYAQLIVDGVVPLLVLLCDQFPLSDGKDMLVIVEFMGIESKKLEQQFRQGRFVLVSKALDLLQIVCKVAHGPIRFWQLVGHLVQRR